MDAKWRQLCPGARRNRPMLEKSRAFQSRRDGLTASSDWIITAVIGEGQDGGQVLLAVLSNDAKTGEGASLAGNVEGGVPAVVHQSRVGTGLQELLDQLWLMCDHSEVKGSLGKKKRKKKKSISLASLQKQQACAAGLDQSVPVSGGSARWGRGDGGTVWSSGGRGLWLHEWWPSGEAWEETRKKRVFIQKIQKKRHRRRKQFQQKDRGQSLRTWAFRNIGLLLGYFHQLWFDTSDALSVPGSGPGTFLNSRSDFKLRPGCARARADARS